MSARETELHAVPDLSDEARTLAELRDALRAHEASHLSRIAESLALSVERVSEAVERLERMSPGEWLTTEEAAHMLGWNVESFQRTDAPRHYLAPRVIRCHREEIREWAKSRPGSPNGKPNAL